MYKFLIQAKRVAVGALLMAAQLQMFAAINETEVRVSNAEAGITLAGTLTLPEAGRPKAVMVMATGSGQQNRDEEIMGHKPFKVIAEYLTGRGYGVLRMDDRGAGASEGDFSVATTDDFVMDVMSGVRYLDSCFHGVPVGIIGHSEGGSVAIKAASGHYGHEKCDFIVTLAAPAWSGDSIIMSQSRAVSVNLLGRWDGEPVQRRILDIAKSQMSDFQARPMLYAILSESLGDVVKLPAVRQQLSGQVETLVSPWYRSMLRYDPADDIKSVSVPWLAMNGDRDLQVLSGNLATISELNSGVTAVTLDGHNHLFQVCRTGLPQEYATITDDVSLLTLETMAGWLDGLFGGEK